MNTTEAGRLNICSSTTTIPQVEVLLSLLVLAQEEGLHFQWA
jgi:hypothetical protein